MLVAFTPTVTAEFPDVPKDSWYAPYVEEVTDAGLLQSYPDGRFGSWDPVNRAEMSKIIVNLKNQLQKTPETWLTNYGPELAIFFVTVLGWIVIIKRLGAHRCHGQCGQKLHAAPSETSSAEALPTNPKNETTNWWT